MYTFRGVKPEDFEVVRQFPQDALEQFYMGPGGEHPLPAGRLEKIAESRWKPTVILDGDEVVGYANIYGLEPDKHGWLGNVIIKVEYRGKGAASALISEMLRIAGEELHIPKLQLACHNTNLQALLFYKKLGFKPFNLNKMKNHLGETVVSIYMELETHSNLGNS